LKKGSVGACRGYNFAKDSYMLSYKLSYNLKKSEKYLILYK